MPNPQGQPPERANLTDEIPAGVTTSEANPLVAKSRTSARFRRRSTAGPTDPTSSGAETPSPSRFDLSNGHRSSTPKPSPLQTHLVAHQPAGRRPTSRCCHRAAPWCQRLSGPAPVQPVARPNPHQPQRPSTPRYASCRAITSGDPCLVSYRSDTTGVRSGHPSRMSVLRRGSTRSRPASRACRVVTRSDEPRAPMSPPKHDETAVDDKTSVRTTSTRMATPRER